MLTLKEAVKIAPKLKVVQEWVLFKKKWDGHFPRKGSKAHVEMQADGQKAQKALQAVLDRR